MTTGTEKDIETCSQSACQRDVSYEIFDKQFLFNRNCECLHHMTKKPS